MEKVACHQTDDVALVPPAPGGKVPYWQVVCRGKGGLIVDRIVFVPIIESLKFIKLCICYQTVAEIVPMKTQHHQTIPTTFSVLLNLVLEIK